MPVIFLDMTERCPRDRYFLNPKRMLRLANYCREAAQSALPGAETIFCRAPSRFGATDPPGCRVIDAPEEFAALLPCEALKRIWTMASSMVETDRVLYLNPLQGQICPDRINDLLHNEGNAPALISVSAATSHEHPLWTKLVPKRLFGKKRFITKSGKLQPAFKRFPELAGLIQDETKITGSQNLKAVYKRDGACILLNMPPDDTPDSPPVLVPWKNRYELDAPWEFSLPIWSMNRQVEPAD